MPSFNTKHIARMIQQYHTSTPTIHLRYATSYRFRFIHNTTNLIGNRRKAVLPLPEHYTLHDLHSVLRHIHPSSAYNICYNIEHPIFRTIPCYSYYQTPDRFTLKNHTIPNGRSFTHAHVPDAIGSHIPVRNILHQLEQSIVQHLTKHQSIDNTIYTNKKIISDYTINDNNLYPTTCIQFRFSDNQHQPNNTLVKHIVLASDLIINDTVLQQPAYIMAPNLQDQDAINIFQQLLSNITDNIKNRINDICATPLLHQNLPVPIYSHHTIIQYIRTLESYSTNTTLPIYQHLLSCYRAYLAQYPYISNSLT